MTRITTPLCLLAVLAVPQTAFAQNSGSFQLPAGCTAYVTVQTQACSVVHHFTCDGDPEGWQRRVDMDESGVVYFGAIDAETQWVESYHVGSGYSETLESNPVDPASFSELVTRNIDTYDFRTLSDAVGATRYVGQDRLTGVTEVIDGVTLDQTEYAITAYDADGNEMWRSHGQEFISRDWGVFMSGVSTVTAGGETWESSDRPMEFIFPDEPGFLSTQPKYGCGVMLSSLTLGGDIPPPEVPRVN